jgi:hypothetical protein
VKGRKIDPSAGPEQMNADLSTSDEIDANSAWFWIAMRDMATPSLFCNELPTVPSGEKKSATKC